MSLTIDKRHGTAYWYIRGTVRGVRVDESTRTTDRREAQAICERREERIKKQQDDPKSCVTFLTIATQYLEAGKEDRFVGKLLDYFGAWPVSEIDQKAVDTFIRKECQGLKQPSSINRQVFTPLTAIMKYGALSKLCDDPRYERREGEKERVRWIKIEEADKLRASCAKHLAPLVTFLLYTGCRAGEAVALDWADVDLEKRHVDFVDTKNGDRRGAPLVPVVLDALRALPHRTGRVFRTDEGKPYATKADGGGHFKSAFRSACQRAGITNFHPHDCRHTWATWHYKENHNLGELMELGGWKTMSMVMRYAHTNTETLEAGALRLPGSSGAGG